MYLLASLLLMALLSAASAEIVKGPPMGNFHDAVYVNFEIFGLSGWVRTEPGDFPSASVLLCPS